jgi:hypothetical protein
MSGLNFLSPSPGPCFEVRNMLVLSRKGTVSLHSNPMLQYLHLTSPTTEYSTNSQVYTIYYGTRMRHPQLVTYTVTPPQSYTILFSIYFRYSHAGGKFRHNYTGSLFRKFAYMSYDVELFVDYMDFILHDSRWDSVVGIATGYGLDERGVGVRVPLGSRIFSTSSRPILGPTWPPNQWVPGALSRG